MMRAHKARISKDDWIATTEKQERKRRQNRLNQKALRERRRTDEVQIVSGKKPYRVSRWRIGQPREQLKVQSSSSTVDAALSASPQTHNGLTTQPAAYAVERSTPESDFEILMALVESTDFSPKTTFPTPPTSVNFPLSSDHLIRLIHQNVFSALMSNKALLNKTTYMTKPTNQGPNCVMLPSQNFCEGLTLIHPIIEEPLPQSLHPTPLQMKIPHSSWLNMFPWPRFRDNLIVNESIVDAAAFLYDLFGDLVTYNGSSIDFDLSISSPNEDDGDVDARRRGLIVWGEPWDTEGWEVTEGFMQRWSWLLEGCEELIEVSNRWRARRYENPL